MGLFLENSFLLAAESGWLLKNLDCFELNYQCSNAGVEAGKGKKLGMFLSFVSLSLFLSAFAF